MFHASIIRMQSFYCDNFMIIYSRSWVNERRRADNEGDVDDMAVELVLEPHNNMNMVDYVHTNANMVDDDWLDEVRKYREKPYLAQQIIHAFKSECMIVYACMYERR